MQTVRACAWPRPVDVALLQTAHAWSEAHASHGRVRSSGHRRHSACIYLFSTIPAMCSAQSNKGAQSAAGLVHVPSAHALGQPWRSRMRLGTLQRFAQRLPEHVLLLRPGIRNNVTRHARHAPFQAHLALHSPLDPMLVVKLHDGTFALKAPGASPARSRTLLHHQLPCRQH